MRRVAVSFAVFAGSFALAASPAAAKAPLVKELPPAACNQGTQNAHRHIPRGVPGHPHVPHFMMGFCMTMPGSHP